MDIIQLDGLRNGPKRIAERFAAERARVESFNRHMIYALMPHRTAMWKGITTSRSAFSCDVVSGRLWFS